MSSEAMHASAPEGCGCADCAIDREACPTCYAAWWKKRHPNVLQIEAAVLAEKKSEQPQSEQPSNAHLAAPQTEPVRGDTGRTALAPNEYRCAMCCGVFIKGWSDEEAAQEAAASHGVPLDDCDIVCDDCYKKTPWGASA